MTVMQKDVILFLMLSLRAELTSLLAKEIMKPVPKIEDDNQKKDELFLKSSRIKLQSDFTEDNTIFPLRQYFNQREWYHKGRKRESKWILNCKFKIWAFR